MSVRKVPGRGKTWVRVRTPATGSLVAFEDLFDMITLLIECEVEKYDNGQRSAEAAWERWGRQLRQLLKACTEYGTDWDSLAEEFDLPRRDGSRPVGIQIVMDDDYTAVWQFLDGEQP